MELDKTYEMDPLESKAIDDLTYIVLNSDMDEVYSKISTMVRDISTDNTISELESYCLAIRASIFMKEFFNHNMFGEQFNLSDITDWLAISLAEYLKIILYPISNGYSILNKTVKDFNIDVDFFNKVFFAYKYIKDEDTYPYPAPLVLNKYSFDGCKLKEFSLKNIKNGIIYFYDENYNQVNIESPNGNTVPSE